MKVKRLKDLLKSSLKYGLPESGFSEDEVPLNKEKIRYIRITDIQNDTIINTSSRYLYDINDSHILNKNDILFARSGATVGKTYIFDHYEKSTYAGYLIKLTLNSKNNPKYVYYYLNSFDYWKQIKEKQTSSTIENVNSNILKNIFITVHPKDYQDKIAKFLDENCSKIDTEISLLEKKSALLEEYKQSLIFETVTKGLDKNAKMKDSGVDWIGEIPEHWKIKRVLDYFNGLKQITKAGRTDVLSLTLNGVVEKDIDNLKGLNPQSYDTYQIFKKNDLVFKLIDLENYKTSRVGLVFKDGIMSSAYIRLEPKNNTNIDYTYYQFFDLYNRGIFNYLGGNGVRSNLTKKDLLKLPLIIPPLEEQKNISLFLKEELKKIDETVNLIYKKLDLLKEYKQSLIHEAVTGQLEI